MRAIPSSITTSSPADAGFDDSTGSTNFLSEQTGRVQFTANSNSGTSYYYYTITADAEL